MPKEYVALAFISEVREKVEEWLKEAGGNLEIKTVESLPEQEFKYGIKAQILTEEQVENNPHYKRIKELLFRHECGRVYLK